MSCSLHTVPPWTEQQIWPVHCWTDGVQRAPSYPHFPLLTLLPVKVPWTCQVDEWLFMTGVFVSYGRGSNICTSAVIYCGNNPHMWECWQNGRDIQFPHKSFAKAVFLLQVCPLLWRYLDNGVISNEVKNLDASLLNWWAYKLLRQVFPHLVLKDIILCPRGPTQTTGLQACECSVSVERHKREGMPGWQRLWGKAIEALLKVEVGKGAFLSGSERDLSTLGYCVPVSC